MPSHLTPDELARKDVEDLVCLEQKHSTDPMENAIAVALTQAGIPFRSERHPERSDPAVTLDFELPNGLYLEVKRFHAPRVEKQLAQAPNVVLAQGKGAVEWLASLLRASRRSSPSARAVLPALVRPGMYAGPQGARTDNEWRADAVEALLAPYYGIIARL